MRWLLKENLVLNALEDELAAEVNKLAHAWHCAAAQLTEWDDKEERFEFHRREASKVFKAIGRALLPWYKRWGAADELDLAQAYRKFREEEKNPAYQRWRRKELEKLKSIGRELKQRSALGPKISKARQETRRQRTQLKKERIARGGLLGR